MSRSMIIAALVLLLALPLGAAGVFAPAPAQANGAPEGRAIGIDTTALDAVIAAQMARHGLPGVAVAVVEGDKTVYLKGYGTAGARPMTPQTQMFIGSQSKSFTALAIAQLAQQGRLDLDAPVRRYIPWFAVDDPEASARITISHLLHHTSGLSEAGYGVILPETATGEAAVRSLARARLSAPVGTAHQYFNVGYDVLAYLVEVVSGQRYADYIEEHVFTPLGMTRSTADPATATDLAWGYTRLFGVATPMQQRVPAYEIGAGYIISTAEDMARFAEAMLHEGRGLITPAMARRIFAPGRGDYGMGWYIVDGGAKIFHGGANETFRTDVNLYPRSDRAFVLLVNEGHLVDHFVSAAQLSRGVEALVRGGPAGPAPEGWSVRWIGHALGLLVLGLCLLHIRNFIDLFGGWRARVRAMSPLRRTVDVAISFAIPTVILLVVFSQMAAFFGYRFHLATTMASFRFAMPDVFILMLVGSLPDYAQGLIKLTWLLRERPA